MTDPDLFLELQADGKVCANSHPAGAPLSAGVLVKHFKNPPPGP